MKNHCDNQQLRGEASSTSTSFINNGFRASSSQSQIQKSNTKPWQRSEFLAIVTPQFFLSQKQERRLKGGVRPLVFSPLFFLLAFIFIFLVFFCLRLFSIVCVFLGSGPRHARYSRSQQTREHLLSPRCSHTPEQGRVGSVVRFPATPQIVETLCMP